jgi:YVTN family beta-propeller protein
MSEAGPVLLGMSLRREPNMKCTFLRKTSLAGALLAFSVPAWAGQAPGKASDADAPVSHHDRVYVAEQFSNTVSVTDPVDNKLLGVIRLGDPQPANLSPLYHGQVLGAWYGIFPRS